ncbi:cysteine hydrolase family protein [Agromyces soli]|uniref:Cysteine hydrolase n=1 Tax=Agromyces soli TaxID=659012 RepID=A0ABY4ATK6_9MICO|nr:cysteine hydrolase family protein [Agromyces soli]UOE26484.1 cysteine hydrolase [Agromyces soli]
MTRTLLIIDIQQDYFPGGRHPLVGPEAAAERAAEVLAAWRERGEPVVHIQHVWDAPDAAFFQPGTPGVEIHPSVAPRDGETLLTKALPNAFLGTGLERVLREQHAATAAEGAPQLVVMGMMSSMCVDATVRAAADLGFQVTVVHDACAAPDLAFGGVTVPAAQVHAAFMAALGDSYAAVTSTEELLTAN